MNQENQSLLFPFDINMFNDLKSNTNKKQLLEKFQQQEKNDQIIQRKLIEIIKSSAHQNGIENIAGRAISILKKLTKSIRWENFSKITLKDCSMNRMNFIDCNFSESILENVSIEACWFLGCCLDRVKWSNIICSGQKISKIEDVKIHSLTTSPDGSLLFSKTEKGKQFQINIQDLYSGIKLKRIQLQKHIIQKTLFIMNEIIAFPINYDKNLKIQNIRNGKFKIIQFSHTILSQFYINNGIIIINSRKIIVYQCSRSKILRTIDINGKSLEVASSCGRYAAFHHNHLIEICDLLRAKTFIIKDYATEGLNRLLFTQNNQEIAGTSLDMVYFWNLKSLKLSRQIKLINSSHSEPSPYKGLILSNDAKTLIAFHGNVITLYDIETGQKIKHLIVNQEIQFVVSHSIKQILIVVCKENYIFYIDYTIGKDFIKKSYNPSLSQFALSQDTEFIASVSSGQLKVVNLQTGKEIKCLEIRNITSTSFSPLTKILLLGRNDSSISFYDIQTQECKKIQYDQQFGLITNIVFSPDGMKMAFTGSQVHHIVICNGITGSQLILLKGHSKQIQEIQFSPDGQLLASTTDKTIKLWNPESQNKCSNNKVNFYGSNSFAFSPNRTYITYANRARKTIIFYNISQNKYRFVEYPNEINQFKFFQDWLFLLCCIQEKLEILDVETGEILRSYKFQASTIFFSFDEKILVSCSKDSIQLWNVFYEKSDQISGKFHQFQIKLVNLYLKVGEYIKGIYSTYDKAEIISKHGFNLVEVLKNSL